MLKLTAALGISLILSACSSDSGGNAPVPLPVDDSISVQIDGRIADAVTGAALAGVSLAIGVPGSEQSLRSTTTDADGRYTFADVPGSNDLRVSIKLTGYREETYQSIDTMTVGDQTLASVNLVSDDNAGLGSIGGQISNALTGDGVPDVSLACRRGINTKAGQVVANSSTDTNGRFLIDNIDYGNLTCEIVGAEFVTAFATVLALGNTTVDNQNSVLTPKLDASELRIVLSWGASPSDLDSHLTGPVVEDDRFFHVFFGDGSDGPVNLDVDDVSAFGPETITIDQQVDGVYRYTVHDYSNRGNPTASALANSGAQVGVFNELGLVQTFFVPAGAGNLWTVFDMRGSVITPINTVAPLQSNNDFFPSEALANSASETFESRPVTDSK